MALASVIWTVTVVHVQTDSRDKTVKVCLYYYFFNSSLPLFWCDWLQFLSTSSNLILRSFWVKRWKNTEITKLGIVGFYLVICFQTSQRQISATTAPAKTAVHATIMEITLPVFVTQNLQDQLVKVSIPRNNYRKYLWDMLCLVILFSLFIQSSQLHNSHKPFCIGLLVSLWTLKGFYSWKAYISRASLLLI